MFRFIPESTDAFLFDAHLGSFQYVTVTKEAAPAHLPAQVYLGTYLWGPHPGADWPGRGLGMCLSAERGPNSFPRV